MSEEKRVGTRCITFHVTVFEPPIDIAEVRVDVPIYVTTCETIGNYVTDADSKSSRTC